MSTPSLRFQLRERTAAAHAALDAAVGEFGSRPGYVRYLRGLLAFREPTEAALAAVDLPEWIGGFRPIAAAIRDDLRDLGVAVPERAQAHRDLVGEMRDPSRLVGTLYVLEGSALGARLLARRAADLGLSASFGARHLAAQTADKLAWRRFLDVLERRDRIDVEAAIGASTAAFERAQRAFAKEFDDVDA